jgi:hypothetical protein
MSYCSSSPEFHAENISEEEFDFVTSRVMSSFSSTPSLNVSKSSHASMLIVTSPPDAGPPAIQPAVAPTRPAAPLAWRNRRRELDGRPLTPLVLSL